MQLHYINTAFQGNYEAIVKRLRVDEDMEDEFRDIYDECMKIAAPKGVFTECEVTQDGPDTFMNGKRVRSKVVYSAFQGIEKAYPHVVTCGRELYDFAMRTEDPLERFWIDGISEAALGEANAELHRAVQKTYGLGKIASVRPGSLKDYPLPYQRPLFDLLGEGPERIGLELTPSYLMLPYKSTSGVYFESEEKYENCMLCPRLYCPNRREPYDEVMARSLGLEIPDPSDIANSKAGVTR